MSELRKLQVLARIRGESKDNVDSKNSSPESSSTAIRVDGNNRIVLTDLNNNANMYEFDRVYDANTSTEQIYKDYIEGNIINRYYNGYNYLVLAYGATGSGKNHTLYGDKNESEGLIQKSIESLFNKLDSNKSHNKHLLTLSAYQLNNNNILDLLNPQPKINLTLNNNRYLGCIIDNLCTVEVTNTEQTLNYIKQAISVKQQLDLRYINTNQGGHHKSHLFIDFQLETIEKDNPSIIRTSVLRYVLLAGSGGVNLKFNTGLQAINKVVDLLSSDRDLFTINFNQNPLTQLLEFGIGGGNALSSILLFINPNVSSENSSISNILSDSEHTLQFGEKCRKIKNASKINKNTLNTNIRELREEIKRIRGKLNLSQPGQYLHDINPNDLKLLKQLINQLEQLKSQTWEKKREKSREFIEARKVTLESEGLLYILDEDINIPENILNQSKNLLNNIVQAKIAIDETELQLQENRKKYKELLDNNNDNSNNENLQILSQQINELDDRLKQQHIETESITEEYKKILHKISTIEARQRKTFLIHRDYNNLDKLNKANEMNDIKKEIENDLNYINQIQILNSNTEQTQLIIRQRFDESINNTNNQDQNLIELKDETIKLIEDLRIQTEYSKKLEFERDLLWAKLIENKYKNTIEFNKYQEHLYFIFKNYRNHFEEQKIRIENKYRELLDNSIKDALKLQEENNKLKLQLDAKNKLI